MSTPVLHAYFRSSASYRVRIALAYKGLGYEIHPVNILTGAHVQGDYSKLSPTGYVPTLILDGEPFVESMAILELLDELHPEPALLPKAPKERARVRALCEIVNAGIQPLQNLNVLRRVSGDADVQRAWLAHFNTKGLRAFEHRLEQLEVYGVAGPFAYGERFTMADCLLVPQVYAARRNGVDLSEMPRVVRSVEAALGLPFIGEAHPDRQPDAT